VEINNGELLRGKLKKSSRFNPELSFDLTKEELEGVEVRQEAGLFWIRKIGISPRILKQLLVSGEGFGSDTCLPLQGVSEVIPDSIVFDFGVESVGYLLPHLIHSNEVFLRGKTESMQPFLIKLSLTQDRR
jgi:hypothetical protein